MNIAILLSGGIGSRINTDIPKQYISVSGQMIVTHTLIRLLENTLIDAVWIVADKGWQGVILDETVSRWHRECAKKLRGFCSPGTNRQLSIYNALCDISKVKTTEDDVILIQDAVRPLTSYDTITKCLTKTEGHDGALPVLPMKDTVYLSKDKRSISGLLNRSEVFAGQAPEAYRFGKYMRANEALFPSKILQINGACEPAVMYGMDIVMFDGDERNFKLTTDEDLARYLRIMEQNLA